MRYLRYGCLSIAKNLLFTFLMLLEILVLLVSTNMMVASANSREMLKKPYGNIIGYKGYYCFTEPIWDTAEQHDEFAGLFAKFKSAKLYITNQIYGATIVDDEIFFNYSMPLQSGLWPSKANDEQGRAYAVVSPDLNKKVGETIELNDSKTVIVSGILTDITYIPSFSISAKDVTELYRAIDYSANYDEESKGDNSSIIVAKSGFYGDYENVPVDCCCFIVYDNNISDADMKYNETIVEQIKNFNSEEVNIPPTFTDLSTIKEGTDVYISDVYNRMMPIILGVAAVVLIGLIGTIAINTVTQLKNYGIYYLCGSKWSDCMKISFANISIILMFAGVLSVLLLYIAQSFNLNYLIGQSYVWNNLIISVGIIIGMIILALIIPFGIIRFTSPVEVVKSEK